jgi:hypothetical protein
MNSEEFKAEQEKALQKLSGTLEINGINIHISELKTYPEIAAHYPKGKRIGVKPAHLYTYLKRGNFKPQIILFGGKHFIYVPLQDQHLPDWGLSQYISRFKSGPKSAWRHKKVTEPAELPQNSPLDQIQTIQDHDQVINSLSLDDLF